MDCYMNLWTLAGHSGDGVGHRHRVCATRHTQSKGWLDGISIFGLGLRCFYMMGFDMGLMMPCFMRMRGLMLSWCVILVCHSGPTGIRSECSYSCLEEKGWGSCDAR